MSDKPNLDEMEKLARVAISLVGPEEERPALAADVQALLAERETARGLLMDCWHQLDGDVYVLPGGEVHPGAAPTIHALHAFLWPEGKTI